MTRLSTIGGVPLSAEGEDLGVSNPLVVPGQLVSDEDTTSPPTSSGEKRVKPAHLSSLVLSTEVPLSSSPTATPTSDITTSTSDPSSSSSNLSG